MIYISRSRFSDTSFVMGGDSVKALSHPSVVRDLYPIALSRRNFFAVFTGFFSRSLNTSSNFSGIFSVTSSSTLSLFETRIFDIFVSSLWSIRCAMTDVLESHINHKSIHATRLWLLAIIVSVVCTSLQVGPPALVFSTTQVAVVTVLPVRPTLVQPVQPRVCSDIRDIHLM